MIEKVMHGLMRRGWRLSHGVASEALSDERDSQRIGHAYGPQRQSFTLLFLFIPFFPSWLLPLQDTTQRSFKLSNKTIVSQSSACLLMTAYPLDLLFGYTHQKKVPPIPNHFKKGIHLHQMVASA